MDDQDRGSRSPDQPSEEQPTVGWTPPRNASPSPSPPPTPPPTYSAGTGPLLSSTPTPAAGWVQPVTQREVAPGLVFSGTAARFVAYLIDGFLVSLVTGTISAVVGSRGVTPTGEFVWTTGDIIATILSVAVSAAYFIAFWSGGRRATLGQMLLKIQVANAFDGRALTMEQAVRRWIALGEWISVFALSLTAAAAVSGLALVWSLVLLISTVSSPTKQGLHDRFANSAVVRPVDAGNGLVYTCLIVFLILPIVALLAIVSLIFLGGQVSSILSAVGESV